MATFLRAAVRWRAQERSYSIAFQLTALLAIHVLLWTWVGVSSRSNFDDPGDMVEAYAWAQGWQWGYYKHPPLSAWVAGLWFAVVPESHWGYSLLAAANSAVGLAGLAVLGRQFLPARWVLLAVAVASLAPGITTLAMRFNCNSILVSTWPWAMALFVRLMQRGRTRDAVLCGVVCALAMLGKYFSAVLLLSLVATALWLPAWRAKVLRWQSAVAVAVFAACLAPHAIWVLSQTHGPLQYAQEATGQGNAGVAVMRALHFALAQCIFPITALLAFRLALVGPARSKAFLQAATAPLRPRNQVVWLLAMLPIIATMLVTVATGARTAWVWGLAIAAGLALLASSRAHEAGAELSLPRLWRCLFVVWGVIALLSPLWWQARAALKTPSATEPRQELALHISKTWQAEFGGPLLWVGGTRALAASTAFYADEHPGYWSLWNDAVETPWVNTDDVRGDGAAIVCARDDEPCQTLAEAWTADRRSVTVAKNARGHQFEPRSYWLYLVHPSGVQGPAADGVASAR